MASRATISTLFSFTPFMYYGRSALNQIRGQNRSFATVAASSGSHTTRRALDWKRPPIIAMAGLLVGAGLMAAYTGTLHLAYSPTVYVSKRRRGTVPEVEDPNNAINSSNKYLKKSWFRPAAAVRANP